jgi:GntR family transcriptional regulator
MEIAGITELDVEVTTDKDPPVVSEKLKGKRAVIVSPGRLKEIAAMVKRGIEVIEFIYKPDAGSVNLLGSSVLEHRKKNRQEGVERGSGVALGD